MDPATIPSVTLTGEMIIGGLVSLVGLVLGFASKVILRRLDKIEERSAVREQEINARLRSLGHEDREIRQELRETRASMEQYTSDALTAITTSAKLMAKVYTRRGPVTRDPLDDEG